jgi:DNA-binding beta-propeller fold protein YncE
VVEDEVDKLLGSAGSGPGQLQAPLSVACDGPHIYVSDTGNNRIQKFDSQNFDSVIELSAQFTPALNQPSGVSVADDPVQERLYVADRPNNRVLVTVLPKVDPLPTWTSASSSLQAGQIENALGQFSVATVDSYRQLFASIPTARLAQNLGAIGQLTPLYITDQEARYYFTSTISGTPFVFVVTLVKENGLWKIRHF